MSTKPAEMDAALSAPDNEAKEEALVVGTNESPLMPATDKGSEVTATKQASNVTDKTAEVTATKEAFKVSTVPLIEQQPIRNELVQNAVQFLLHPKVRGSPIAHRRSFLEKKGLTANEINEAFQQVPDPPSSAVTNSNLGSEGKLLIPRAAQQAVVPAEVEPPASNAASLRTLQSSRRQLWPQLMVGMGLLAAAGAGTGYLFQTFLVPKLKEWIRSVVHDNQEGELVKKKVRASPVGEAAGAAAAAASAAAVAVAEVAAINRELLKSRTEGWENLANIMKSLEHQTKELRDVLGMVQGLPRQTLPTGNSNAEEAKWTESQRENLSRSQNAVANQISINNIMTKPLVSNGAFGSSAFQEKATYGDDANDVPWWRHKKPEVETFALSEQHAESSSIPVPEVGVVSDGSSIGDASS